MTVREYCIVVTGGRDFADAEHVSATLDIILEISRARGFNMTLINGLARGADSMCRAWAIARNVTVIDFPADWENHGRAAGHIRNSDMLDNGKPHVCIAFPGGRGTANMVKQSQSRGVLVVTSANVRDVYK